jgi:hypothetical protein
VRLNREPIIAVIAGMLGACSVAQPLDMQSVSKNLMRGGLSLTVEQADAGTDRGRFGGALRDAFAMQGMASTPGGGLIADYAYALTDASAGVANGEIKSGEIDWISAPRDSRRFDKCDAKRMRGTLVLFDRATGAQVYRGSASRIDCAFAAADMAEMAQALVKDAMAEAQ